MATFGTFLPLARTIRCGPKLPRSLRPDLREYRFMIRRLVMAIAALFMMAAFTTASVVAQTTCAMDDHQMAMAPQGHQNCPDSTKSHDCANACPSMCGAVAAQQSDPIPPIVATSPEVTIRVAALSGFEEGPDVPPPRKQRQSGFLFN